MLPFSDRPKILQKLGQDFFFFFFSIQNFNFYCKFVTKLAIFSTGSFSLVVRIVLNSSVFGFTARNVLWQSGCHHLLCIFCLGALTLTRRTFIQKKKKKKKDFRPTDPTLKFYPQKGNTTIFFIWPNSDVGLMCLQRQCWSPAKLQFSFMIIVPVNNFEPKLALHPLKTCPLPNKLMWIHFVQYHVLFCSVFKSVFLNVIEKKSSSAIPSSKAHAYSHNLTSLKFFASLSPIS